MSETETQSEAPAGPAAPEPTAAGADGIAADRLRSFVERIERLEDEKSALTADIRDVFAEAKSAGFDTKIMRQVIKLRRMEQHDRNEQQELIDLYMHALGMR
jgi:uncharacterized protein (UPF0335 family)